MASDPIHPVVLLEATWMRLSPIASYQIRKLLHQRSHSLQFVVFPGAALQADTLSDLNSVLESLYLEEAEIQSVARKLETLAQYHRTLTQRGLYRDELTQVEQEIFWLLGFKQIGS